MIVEGEGYRLYRGDCLEVMQGFPTNSIDTVITDPPYGLNFMGKNWDHGVPGLPFWTEILRVAKPGAMLLAFGGTRTWHRLAVAIEDSGWEIRDTLMFLYGSGFPKSLDIGKAIDKAAGAEREVIGLKPSSRLDGSAIFNSLSAKYETLPTTDAAKEWNGWGSSLKPAWEPIILAMKPLDGTFAENAQKWGCAGLNIDGCRIGTGESLQRPERRGIGVSGGWANYKQPPGMYGTPDGQGRWPANLILDEEAAVSLDEMSGESTPSFRQGDRASKSPGRIFGNLATRGEGCEQKNAGYTDTGGASRYFKVVQSEESRFIYTSKASRSERDQGAEDLITWENADLSQETEALLQLLRDISADTMQELNAFVWNIESSGNNITGKSRTAINCIIRTASKLITDLKTLNLLTPQLIREYTLDAIRQLTVHGSSPAENVNSISRLIQSSTDAPAESARGVVNAVSKMLLQISEKGRRGNVHSTVKPLSLMQFLVRLTKTPKGGTVLDPFMGSGTTGVACMVEGRQFVGIDKEPEYVEIAHCRLEHWQDEVSTEPRKIKDAATHTDLPLFAEVGE